MTEENILVIGAGASGLMAAWELSKKGKRVTLLEAKDKPGGRILDVHDIDVPSTVMLGAEFVHGRLPLTFSLIEERGLEYSVVSGDSYQASAGLVEKYRSDGKDWELVMKKLEEIDQDMSLCDFLDRYFSEDKFANLRASVIGFVQGYDAADPERVSIISLKKEWQLEEEEQYRIKGGYSKLVDFLENECLINGCGIYYHKVVSHFNWSEGFVEAITAEGERYAGQKAIITLPLGVLQIKNGGLGSVSFTPPLPVRMGAVRSMGFGAVIKVLLVFDRVFWWDTLPDAGFIFSDEMIPTWWTQFPDGTPVLTGWLAGPRAEEFFDKSEEELIEMGLTSVSKIWRKSHPELKEYFVRGYAYNWATDPFERGAYMYTTVEEPDAPAVLAGPVEGVLFFAGEATYSGPYVGTVEAALVSGKEAAEKVLRE